MVADRFCDLLRVDQSATGFTDRELIEFCARLPVVSCRLVEMVAVATLLNERNQEFNRSADITHHTDVDWRAAPDLFWSHIHLRDAHPRSKGIELTVWKVGAEHQEHVAIEHSEIARRETDQAGHADIKRVFPFNVFLASQCMHDQCLQAISQCEDLIVRPLASRATQYCHAAIAVEKGCETIDMRACRHRDRAAG